MTSAETTDTATLVVRRDISHEISWDHLVMMSFCRMKWRFPIPWCLFVSGLLYALRLHVCPDTDATRHGLSFEEPNEGQLNVFVSWPLDVNSLASVQKFSRQW